MNIADYQDAATRTCVTTDQDETIRLALIGLASELGEIAEPLKKHLWQGHDLDTSHLQEEIGDLMWYLATLCQALTISLAEALVQNMEKLSRRYPTGFSTRRSLDCTTYDDAESSACYRRR